ncbi:hypothetical protein ACUMHR_16965 [Rossellomorea marisflavi]|uniref:hypothetical protein n=1 Tax=Rossellomorea marisflavi TaxID=189381 RepID=UPI004043C879
MITFLLMTLFVVISPGVDTALITKRTIGEAKKTASGWPSGFHSAPSVIRSPSHADYRLCSSNQPGRSRR